MPATIEYLDPNSWLAESIKIQDAVSNPKAVEDMTDFLWDEFLSKALQEKIFHWFIAKSELRKFLTQTRTNHLKEVIESFIRERDIHEKTLIEEIIQKNGFDQKVWETFTVNFKILNDAIPWYSLEFFKALDKVVGWNAEFSKKYVAITEKWDIPTITLHLRKRWEWKSDYEIGEITIQ